MPEKIKIITKTKKGWFRKLWKPNNEGVKNSYNIYDMYVFKESGKWYTTEMVGISTDIPTWELEIIIESGDIDVGYKGMTKVFIPHDNCENGFPFMVKAPLWESNT